MKIDRRESLIKRAKIMDMRNRGYTYKAIGQEIGLSKQRIYQIVWQSRGYAPSETEVKKLLKRLVFCKDKIAQYQKESDRLQWDLWRALSDQGLIPFDRREAVANE